MEFEKEISLKLRDGQEEYEYKMKELLYRQLPKWFEILDFKNKKTFLEPLLFSYFNFSTNRIQIPQILFGYIERLKRPRKIYVLSDSHGIIYLPNFGYLISQSPDSQLFLIYDKTDDSIRLFKNQVAVTFKRYNLDYLDNCEIEVFGANNLFTTGITKENRELIEITEPIDSNRILLHKSVEIIKQNTPQNYQLIKDTFSKIFVFASSAVESLGKSNQSNCAFLNLGNSPDEVSMIDQINRQCGDIMNNYILWDKNEYFEVDPNTPLNQFNCGHSDHHSVLDTFRSLMPDLLSNICFYRCIQNNTFVGTQAVRCKEKHVQVKQRLKNNMQVLDNPSILTERGLGLLGILKKKYDNIYSLDRQVSRPSKLRSSGNQISVSKLQNISFLTV